MTAMFLWSIHDFPAYGNFAGWSTNSLLTCPNCIDKLILAQNREDEPPIFGQDLYAKLGQEVPQELLDSSEDDDPPIFGQGTSSSRVASQPIEHNGCGNGDVDGCDTGGGCGSGGSNDQVDLSNASE